MSKPVFCIHCGNYEGPQPPVGPGDWMLQKCKVHEVTTVDYVNGTTEKEKALCRDINKDGMCSKFIPEV